MGSVGAGGRAGEGRFLRESQHGMRPRARSPSLTPLSLLAMHDAAATAAVRDLVRPLLLIDLRIQCRARGLNPGGGRDTLADRLAEHMLETGDR